MMKKLLYILIFVIAGFVSIGQTINVDTLLLIDTNAVEKGKLYYLKFSGDTLFINSDFVVSGSGNEITVSDSTWHLTDSNFILKVQPYQEKKEEDPYYPYFYDDSFGLEDCMGYGYLYNWYATQGDSIAAEGWHIPEHHEMYILRKFLDPIHGGDGLDVTNNAGAKMKKYPECSWEWQYDDGYCTNEAKFNAIGSGARNVYGGSSIFEAATLNMGFWSDSLIYGSNAYVGFLNLGNNHFGCNTGAPVIESGNSIRLLKDETELEDGEEGIYIGNNGRIYKTICIGTQEWLAENLAETKYRGGTSIPIVTDAEEWTNLTTGARCVYDNNEELAIVYEEGDTPTFYNMLKLDGTLFLTDLKISNPDFASQQWVLYYDTVTKKVTFGDTSDFNVGGDSFWYQSGIDIIKTDNHILLDSSIVSIWNGTYFGNDGSISGFDTSVYQVVIDTNTWGTAYTMAAMQLGVPTVQMTAGLGDQGSQIYLEPSYMQISSDSILISGLPEKEADYLIGWRNDGQVVLTAGIGALSDVSDSTWHLSSNNGVLKVQPYSFKKEENPEYAYFYDGNATMVYGYLYNYYAIAGEGDESIASEGWRVPTNGNGLEDWQTLYWYNIYCCGTPEPPYMSLGYRLRQVGEEYWNSNGSATDYFGFKGRGAGFRSDQNGGYTNLKEWSYFGSSSTDELENMWGMVMTRVDDIFLDVSLDKNTGVSIRLIKENTTLSDGETGIYIGNDGKVYPTICIGNQEWMSVNLAETKYRDGGDIPEVTNNSAWTVLTSGARCSYDNDESYAYSLESTPTYTNEIKLDGVLNMTGATINTFMNFIPTDTEPTPAVEGSVYYDLSEHRLKCYNGTAWKAVKWTDD